MDKEITTRVLGIISLASPILLIHGYGEDASVWDTWRNWLTADNFTNVYPITFKDDDPCGSVASHASELSGMVDDILNDTGSKQVDIVAFSKGGLDARWYVSHNPDKVANLVMIGTPNLGTPAAYMEVTPCWFGSMAGREDLLPGSNATQVPDRMSTNYWTISGNHPVPCFIVMQRWDCYISENDGFVEVESSKSHYESLGVFAYNHSSLLTQKDVYEKVLPHLKK